MQGAKSGQHTLLICGFREQTKKYTLLDVYDCNYPNYDSYLRFDKKGKVKEFVKNNGSGKSKWKIIYTISPSIIHPIEKHNYKEIKKYR